jgi:hypothetical protein
MWITWLKFGAEIASKWLSFQPKSTALNTVQAMLPANFPPHIWDKVSAGVRRHARQFVGEFDM